MKKLLILLLLSPLQATDYVYSLVYDMGNSHLHNNNTIDYRNDNLLLHIEVSWPFIEEQFDFGFGLSLMGNKYEYLDSNYVSFLPLDFRIRNLLSDNISIGYGVHFAYGSSANGVNLYPAIGSVYLIEFLTNRNNEGSVQFGIKYTDISFEKAPTREIFHAQSFGVYISLIDRIGIFD